MKITKTLLVGLAGAIILVGASFILVDKAKANDAWPHDSIITRLVEKFGLKEEDVKTVFEEERQERQQQRQTEREDRLNQAVSDGVITEDQKQWLLEHQQQKQVQHQADNQGPNRGWRPWFWPSAKQ